MGRESLDTNILLRLYLKDIPAQFELAKRLVEAPGKKFTISDTAIIEYVFVLERHYGFTRDQIAEMVTALMSRGNFYCNRTVFPSAIELYRRNQALSFEDCYLAEIARIQEATPLWTFDKALAQKCPVAQELK
ncbi:MAG: PIN domain-containing protein [Coriobacteriia bacterium]|nr:PIN domain-containing protein [Coriobacteriia bacterium]